MFNWGNSTPISGDGAPITGIEDVPGLFEALAGKMPNAEFVYWVGFAGSEFTLLSEAYTQAKADGCGRDQPGVILCAPKIYGEDIVFDTPQIHVVALAPSPLESTILSGRTTVRIQGGYNNSSNHAIFHGIFFDQGVWIGDAFGEVDISTDPEHFHISMPAGSPAFNNGDHILVRDPANGIFDASFQILTITDGDIVIDTGYNTIPATLSVGAQVKFEGEGMQPFFNLCRFRASDRVSVQENTRDGATFKDCEFYQSGGFRTFELYAGGAQNHGSTINSDMSTGQALRVSGNGFWLGYSTFVQANVLVEGDGAFITAYGTIGNQTAEYALVHNSTNICVLAYNALQNADAPVAVTGTGLIIDGGVRIFSPAYTNTLFDSGLTVIKLFDSLLPDMGIKGVERNGGDLQGTGNSNVIFYANAIRSNGTSVSHNDATADVDGSEFSILDTEEYTVVVEFTGIVSSSLYLMRGAGVTDTYDLANVLQPGQGGVGLGPTQIVFNGVLNAGDKLWVHSDSPPSYPNEAVFNSISIYRKR